MNKYKITIAYDGTHYHGWQIQPHHITIQAVIEDALLHINGHKTRIEGAGRTDAGVHALGQVAHFETHVELSPTQWKKAFNSRLPLDIRILSVQKVKSAFHARKSARLKWYRYTICLTEDLCVFDRNRKLRIAYPINISQMRKAAKFMLGKKDLSSFGVNPRRRDGKKDNPVKDLKEIKIRKNGNDLTIDLKASGFLYKMARSIVGTLLEVGRAKVSALDIQKIIDSKERGHAGPSALAHGLCLMEVTY